MKFSVFTPTHNTAKLFKAFKSLKKQTYKDFEWILLLNNNASKEDIIIKEIVSHFKDQVRVVHIKDVAGAEDNGFIGNYKKICCSLAVGDVLVELDHDDALETNCLEVLATHFIDSETDFVYSSCYEYGYLE